MGIALAPRTEDRGPEAPGAGLAARTRRYHGWTHGAVLTLYSGLTVLMTWPAASHLRTKALSNGGDGSSGLWGQWYLPYALLHGHNPIGNTRAIFWPVGANLIVHTTAGLPTLLAAPFVPLLGLVGAFNLMELSALPLSGYAMWLLVRRVSGDPPSAFVAGAAFAFVPYHFVHTTSHVNLLHVELLPFAWLATLHALDSKRRSAWLVLGLAVGAALLTDFTLAAMVLIGVAIILVARRPDARASVRGVGMAAVVAAVVALPVVVTGVSAILHNENSRVVGLGGANVFSADFVSWLVPSEAHPLWGHVFASMRQRFSAGGEGLAFPGLTVLALPLIAALTEWRRGRVRRRDAGGVGAGTWLAVALAGLVLSLGPFLTVNGHTMQWTTLRGVTGGPPLPYLLISVVPGLDNFRVPGRFAILGIAGFDVLAGIALAHLRGRCHRPSSRVLLTASTLALVLLEFLPGHLATTNARIPPAYRAIAVDGSDRAVLEVPLQWRTGFQTYGDTHPYRDDTEFLYYATRHHHPLVSGMVARLADDRLNRLLSQPLYRQILAAEGVKFDGGPAPTLTFTRADLTNIGIGFVVCHRDVPEPALCGYVQHLGMTVLVDDGTVTIWKTA